jgi:hypothetical protein
MIFIAADSPRYGLPIFIVDHAFIPYEATFSEENGN